MNARSFSGTLVFGAVAAASLPTAFAVLDAGYGAPAFFAHAALVVAVAYGVALARDAREAWRALWLGAALAAIAAIAAPAPATLAVAAGVVVGVVRSHLLRIGGPGRHLLLELALVGGGLALARTVAGPTPLAAAFALWTFFVVQCLAFGTGPVQARTPDGGPREAGDPFERARRAALEQLGEAP